MKIEYNYVIGTMKIWDNIRYEHISAYKDKNDVSHLEISGIMNSDIRLFVKNLDIMTITTEGKDLTFKTKNSSETQSVIDFIYYSHRDIDIDQHTDITHYYISTDYSSGDVILKLIFKMR